MSVSAVASVHEDVHERAREQQEVRQSTENMRAVLFPQEDERYRGEAQKD